MKKTIIFWVLFTLVMTIGLPLFISINLGGKSSREAMPHMELFNYQDRPALAALVQYNKVVSSSEGMNQVRRLMYAQAVDLEKGQVLWNTKLDSDEWIVKAELMGQSDKFLFYFSGGLFVLDKFDGKIVATGVEIEKLNPQLKGLLPSSSDKYRVLGGSLVFLANNGLLYGIEGKDLQAYEMTKISVADFVELTKWGTPSVDYRTCYTMAAISDNGQWLGLIDASEKEKVEAFGTPMGRVDVESARRKLYQGNYLPAEKTTMDLQAVNNEVFLFGGFLTDGVAKLDSHEQSIDDVQKPEFNINKGVDVFDEELKQYFAKRADIIKANAKFKNLKFQLAQGKAMQTDNGYIVIHKASIEPNAEILLSCMAPTGGSQWSIATGLSDVGVHQRYNDRLLLSGTAMDKHASGITSLLFISITDGSAIKYDFGSLGSGFGLPHLSWAVGGIVELLLSLLNILFVAVVLYYAYRVASSPMRGKRRLKQLQNSGQRIEAVVTDCSKGVQHSDGYVPTNIAVEFRNLSGSLVSHRFSFNDSKPNKRRYALNSTLYLRVDPKLKNEPAIVMEGGEGSIDLSSYPWMLGITALVVLGIFTALVFTINDAGGNIAGMGSFDSSLSVIMYIGIVMFFVIRLIASTLKKKTMSRFTLYGVRTQARVVSCHVDVLAF